MLVPYTYRATVVSVHDGDTFTAILDLGFDLSFRTSVRLAGCNARELAMPGGKEARDHLAELLADQHIVLASAKWDKYGGRIDAVVTLVDGGLALSARLVADGWAAAWDGRGPAPVPAWPRAA